MSAGRAMGKDVVQIWEDDLFDRAQEATDLIGYLESIASHKQLARSGGHVLSVDASYGFGKTFFLKRLSEQLAINHPVAFVDAWTDDLQDEPLIAIAATLHEALEPYASGEVQKKLALFGRKVGAISKVVGTGLLRRAAAFMITQTAVDAVDEIVKLDGSDLSADLRKESLKEGSKDIADGLKGSGPSISIEQRIEEFRHGKLLLSEVRQALSGIVSSIEKTGAHLPIVIIIDELDRCRPTYAIKLLEEVKHLFNVDGVVFVLGMHQDQLTHSVASAYGGGFDARSYLSRFIDRKYVLATPSLRRLVDQRVSSMGSVVERLDAPNVADGTRTGQLSKADIVTKYLEGCRVSARDSMKVLDSLEICLSLLKNSYLFMPAIMPMIIEKICGLENFKIENFNWQYWHTVGSPHAHGNDYEGSDPVTFYRSMMAVASMPLAELRRLDSDRESYASFMVVLGDNYSVTPTYDCIRGYRRLVNAVSRFADAGV